ncbi:MAG: hypothetical protein HY553_21755 [Elusimicrobia bacterium]|nr:hypothetical protein [Elusimicrobiota bacterium]
MADFSRDATRKAVLRAALENPLTMYSTGVGLLGTLAVGLFGAAAAPVAVGGLGLGLASGLFTYFVRGNAVADRHVKALYEELQKQRQALMARLEKSLKDLARDAQGEVCEQADQGAKQFRMARERFESLQRTLDDKLQPGELTYSRYLGASEQVYLSVLDNLSVVAALLSSVSAIDPRYIAARKKALLALTSPPEADRKELKTISERERLLSDNLEKVNSLLTSNEEAITNMDKLGVALAEIRTSPDGGGADLDTAIQEMEELAKQAHRYGRDPGGES